MINGLTRCYVTLYNICAKCAKYYNDKMGVTTHHLYTNKYNLTYKNG